MINLHKLAEQETNQRAPKIKNRFLKQTHDIKLSESLSPITKKLDEVKKSTQKLREIVQETQQKTPQLVIKNTPHHQPIERIEGVIYDVELENSLIKTKDNTAFFKTYHDPKLGWMWNGYPIKILDKFEVKIKIKKYNITPGIQKVFTKQSYNTIKSKNDMDKVVFREILQQTDYYNRITTKGRLSGQDRFIKNDLDKEVTRILNLDTKFKGRGVEKIIIPSNKNNI